MAIAFGFSDRQGTSGRRLAGRSQGSDPDHDPEEKYP